MISRKTDREREDKEGRKAINMEGNICKHFMYGYCKLKDHCPKQHINVICPTYRDCDDNGYVLRHPKSCKYFAKNKKCIFKRCAYAHDKEGNILEIEIIENQISALKYEFEELKKKKTGKN